MVLGLGGLGNGWRAAARVWGAPALVGEALSLAAALVWLVWLVLYVLKWATSREEALAELRHPIQAFFIALVPVATLIASIAVAPYLPAAAWTMFVLGVASQVVFSAWVVGELWQGGRHTDATTPTLYMPTVGGCFVSAIACGSFGYPETGLLFFGAGFLSLVVLESIVLHRLMTHTLPVGLRATMGLHLATPAVGAVAYLAVTEGSSGPLRPDAVRVRAAPGARHAAPRALAPAAAVLAGGVGLHLRRLRPAARGPALRRAGADGADQLPGDSALHRRQPGHRLDRAADAAAGPVGEAPAPAVIQQETWPRKPPQNATIVFIDELDSIAPKREEAKGEVERRVVAQLLTLMDGLEARQNVVVIGATNRVNAIDEALRRPGPLRPRDRHRRPRPAAGGWRSSPSTPAACRWARTSTWTELARMTYGFVGADLSALGARGGDRGAAPQPAATSTSRPRRSPPRCSESLRVMRDDFLGALKRIQPSALREIMIQVPDVGWDDVGGLEEAKRALREGIELPLKHPDAFRRLGIRPAKGFLLFGPPGTGKTLLAKAVAREAEANFIATKSADLLSKWYGESEQQVSRLFARARQVAPAVIFIDEIDSLAPVRGGGLGEPAVTERVVNTILAEMDGLEELQGVVVVGATNRPTLLDPALLRPGPLRRAGLRAGARPRRAAQDPAHPHRRDAAGATTSTSTSSPTAPRATPAPTSRTWCAAPGCTRCARACRASGCRCASSSWRCAETRPSVTPEMERHRCINLGSITRGGSSRSRSCCRSSSTVASRSRSSCCACAGTASTGSAIAIWLR